MGAITGLGVGALQALVLARSRGLRRVLVGACEPTGLGTGRAGDLVRDHQKRSRSVHELRCELPRTRIRSYSMIIQNAAAALSVILPVVFNLFFFLLARRFDYPNILRSSTRDVLGFKRSLQHSLLGVLDAVWSVSIFKASSLVVDPCRCACDKAGLGWRVAVDWHPLLRRPTPQE